MRSRVHALGVREGGGEKREGRSGGGEEGRRKERYLRWVVELSVGARRKGGRPGFIGTRSRCVRSGEAS